MIYIREIFFLVCTIRKANIKMCEVKVNVQKGAPWFREKVDNRCVSFILFMFISIVVIW
jgi:hypothetical protein